MTVELTPAQALTAVRQRRADLKNRITELECALARPAPGRSTAWAGRVRDSLADLAAEFQAHVSVTEGPNGLHQELLEVAPRCANRIRRLSAEHRDLEAALAQAAGHLRSQLRAGEQEWMGAEGWVEQVRTELTSVLARLGRHRQRGADLIYEAFQVDVGGET